MLKAQPHQNLRLGFIFFAVDIWYNEEKSGEGRENRPDQH